MVLDRSTSLRWPSTRASDWLAARRVSVWFAIGVTAILGAPVTPPVAGSEPPARGHIWLPPTRGATVLSTYIDAQARYVAAVGDYVESVAIARRHHAEAFSREMDNSIKWVHTYFERRALNKAYRLKENPSYLDQLRKEERVKQEVLSELPAEVQKGDPAVRLNWLLNRIANTSLAYSAIYGAGGQGVNSRRDLKLLPSDPNHIWLTEVNAQYGQKLPFRASDAMVFDEKWPLVFRDPTFEPAKRAFDAARTKGLKEIGIQQEIGWDTLGEMRQAVDGLRSQLERKYPRELRKTMSGQDYVIFDNGRRFVDSLAASVMRLAVTNRMETFDGSNRFNDESVFELIRHMCHRGLEFAPPKPGDEPTYAKLLTVMRHIYLEFQSSDST